uniref:Uncharacterized protein n=1 Tax=Parascaris univalens TaxID=6257 RepID=A0A915A4W2_PARUN
VLFIANDAPPFATNQVDSFMKSLETLQLLEFVSLISQDYQCCEPNNQSRATDTMFCKSMKEDEGNRRCLEFQSKCVIILTSVVIKHQGVALLS